MRPLHHVSVPHASFSRYSRRPRFVPQPHLALAAISLILVQSIHSVSVYRGESAYVSDSRYAGASVLTSGQSVQGVAEQTLTAAWPSWQFFQWCTTIGPWWFDQEWPVTLLIGGCRYLETRNPCLA